jgi:hypothetical protein
MAQQLSRKSLYDLVWAEPIKSLAARFGISDVALKKTCVRAEIPTPERGYWAKREAGKETIRALLPTRPPGMDDEVAIGNKGNARYQHWSEEEILGFVGVPPHFPEAIETVRARIAETVAHVTLPAKVSNWHPAIDRLLKEDEKRREHQLTNPHHMSWNNPLFDGTFERRRLRILNSLFLAVGRMNGRPSINGREGREIRISFFQQHLHLALDRPKGSNRNAHGLNANEESRHTRLCLSILRGFGSETVQASWQDDDARKLEMCLTDITVDVILTAEIHYREEALRQYQWRVQRKAELEAEQRKRKVEAVRAEKERQKRIEQARIDRLLRDATAIQHADAIRKYVETVRLAAGRDGSVSEDEVEQWSKWALAQADRIDPAIGGRFLKTIQDEDAS